MDTFIFVVLVNCFCCLTIYLIEMIFPSLIPLCGHKKLGLMFPGAVDRAVWREYSKQKAGRMKVKSPRRPGLGCKVWDDSERGSTGCLLCVWRGIMESPFCAGQLTGTQGYELTLLLNPNKVGMRKNLKTKQINIERQQSLTLFDTYFC